MGVAPRALEVNFPQNSQEYPAKSEVISVGIEERGRESTKGGQLSGLWKKLQKFKTRPRSGFQPHCRELYLGRYFPTGYLVLLCTRRRTGRWSCQNRYCRGILVTIAASVVDTSHSHRSLVVVAAVFLVA